MTPRLVLAREDVLAFRRRVGALDERLAHDAGSLRRAAWAGLTDSVPRAALLSLHARVEGTTPTTPYAAAFVQLWGPRFSTYVVPAQDRAVFSLGRLPSGGARRRYAEDLAQRLDTFLDGREMPYAAAGRGLGEHHNQLRYAATTGRVLIRWDGARQPTVRTVAAPETHPEEARLELARRYLHVLGPGTVDGFAGWAGLTARSAGPAFAALAPELTPVRTDTGDAWVLTRDEPDLRAAATAPATARLLPSGDAYWLLWGPDRGLLVPDPDRRAQLWTSRVWPGALLVEGEVAGTWRRAGDRLTVSPWRRLPAGTRDAVEAEAASLPLPGPDAPVAVRWDA